MDHNYRGYLLFIDNYVNLRVHSEHTYTFTKKTKVVVLMNENNVYDV